MAAIERTRPVPLTDAERDSLGQIARNLPRLWNAQDNDATRPQGAAAIADQRGRGHRSTATSTEPTSRSSGRAARAPSCSSASTAMQGPRRLPEDTIDLIRRLAAHHPDHQIAAILNHQGRRTGQGCRSPEPRVQARQIPRRHPSRTTTGPRQRAGHDQPRRRRTRRLALHDPPLAA